MSVALTIPPLSAHAADPTGFADLVRRYQGLVCAVAYSATGDRAVSEEVAQEAFLVAWRRMPELAEPPEMPAWLCGIARNLGRNARRKLGREELDPAGTADVADTRPTPLDAAATKESSELVWRALEELPDEVREPLVLYYRSGQSVKEVAESLGLSDDAARQRLSRGRKALRASVAELVERTLESSKPGAAFTAAVVAALGRDALASGAGSTSAAAPAASSAAAVPSLVPIAIAVGAVVIGAVIWFARPGDGESTVQPTAPSAASSAARDGETASAVAPTSGPTASRRARPSDAPAAARARGLPPPSSSLSGPLDERAALQRRIDIDFGEAAAVDIIRLISEVAEVPIVVRGAIEPRVNSRLHDVTALAALDEILEQVGATRTEIPVLRIVPGRAQGADQLTGDPVTAAFDRTPLAEVMTVIAAHLDIPIAVDPALASTPITASFDKEPVGAAFALILERAGAGFETDFGYEVRAEEE